MSWTLEKFYDFIDARNWYFHWCEFSVARIIFQYWHECCRSFPNHLIHTYHLKGVDVALKKHAEKAESKGVKAHFRMDEDGILHLDRVRLHCCQPYCLIKTHLYCTCTMHVLHRTPVYVDVYICQYSLWCFFLLRLNLCLKKKEILRNPLGPVSTC